MNTASLNDALVFVRSMASRAKQHGYILAPYGSTVANGVGKDVDIFAIPWRTPCDYKALLASLSQFGWVEIGDRYFGLLGTCAVLLHHPHHDFQVDLQIREVTRDADLIGRIRNEMATDLAGWR